MSTPAKYKHSLKPSPISLHDWIFCNPNPADKKFTDPTGPFWVTEILADNVLKVWNPVTDRYRKIYTRLAVRATPPKDFENLQESFGSEPGVVALLCLSRA